MPQRAADFVIRYNGEASGIKRKYSRWQPTLDSIIIQLTNILMMERMNFYSFFNHLKIAIKTRT